MMHCPGCNYPITSAIEEKMDRLTRSCEGRQQQIDHLVYERDQLLSKLRQLTPEPIREVNIEDKFVDEFDFPVLAFKCFAVLGIKRIRQLLARTEIDLLKVKGFGRKALKMTKEELAHHGLKLKEE